VASWSSIDYYGEWKALHYYAKRLYVPLAIMPHVVGDRIDLAVVSDRLEAIVGKLTVRLLDLGGKEINASTVPATIAANASAVYATLAKEAFPRGRDDRQLLLLSTLVAGDSVLAENVTYFRTPKEMLLQRPEITMEVLKKGRGYEIALRTNTLARDVYLSADGVPGFFSDNFFDLVPGTTKRIMFTCDKEVLDLRSKLKTLNVFDATEN
jgi:beta-mannosidase